MFKNGFEKTAVSFGGIMNGAKNAIKGIGSSVSKAFGGTNTSIANTVATRAPKPASITPAATSTPEWIKAQLRKDKVPYSQI